MIPGARRDGKRATFWVSKAMLALTRMVAVLVALLSATGTVLPLAACRCVRPLPPVAMQDRDCCRQDASTTVRTPCCKPTALQASPRATVARESLSPPSTTPVILPFAAVSLPSAWAAGRAPCAPGRPPGTPWQQLSPILRV